MPIIEKIVHTAKQIVNEMVESQSARPEAALTGLDPLITHLQNLYGLEIASRRGN
jgi:hypothetical protein